MLASPLMARHADAPCRNTSFDENFAMPRCLMSQGIAAEVGEAVVAGVVAGVSMTRAHRQVSLLSSCAYSPGAKLVYLWKNCE
jgi:hypothetical protein